jgi:hypothetical protein
MKFRMLALVLIARGAPADPADFFESRVRPLLAKKCFACHTDAHSGGLTMRSRESLLQGGNSGPAIVPGNPDQSLLMQAVRQTHPRIKMPPQGKLDPEEIAAIETWVKAGAVWPDAKEGAPAATQAYVIRPEQRRFWSFQPVRKAPLPEVKNRARVKSPIDAFILAKLEAAGLAPAPPADKRTLIRRATLDLHGLPPTPEEIDNFVIDSSPDAFAKVVDRLLASPRYGERWARYWLDVARYSDDQLNATQDVPLQNAFRYRDWVVKAFQDDMPYDLFVKAQIAGDLLDHSKQLIAGLGFYALSPSPEFHEDRVDATGRGFLGLTVACAECHNHKYDPIATRDYYSLLGIFENTEDTEIPLVPQPEVDRYQKQKKELEAEQSALKKFLETERHQLVDVLANQTAAYVTAAWSVLGPQKIAAADAASAGSLDAEVLARWLRYLAPPAAPREHHYLKAWDEMLGGNPGGRDGRQVATAFQQEVLAALRQKESIDEKNVTILAEAKVKNDKSPPVLSLPRDQYFLLRDVTDPPPTKRSEAARGSGVLYYSDDQLAKVLFEPWKRHVEALRARIAKLKKEMPPAYAYLRAIRDKPKPINMRVHIADDKENLGEEAPRRFLPILCKGEPPAFTKGSGRLELAEAIASPDNPLTARVMVNRIWAGHFGSGIVRTPGDFGKLGERPTHPELLDYLASRFVENHWSIKAMHREIMLSSTYLLSSRYSEKAYTTDPDNKLLWRASTRRLDFEALRDSLLFVSGQLDLTAGGPPQPVSDVHNLRRSIYCSISRRHLDPLMRLFDFPDPNSTSDERMTTNVPLQELFFLNSNFLLQAARALARRLTGADESRISQAYRLLFGRAPEREEVQLGRAYLDKHGKNWPQYAQVLLSANEFLFVN